jgi:hypothetical protein
MDQTLQAQQAGPNGSPDRLATSKLPAPPHLKEIIMATSAFFIPSVNLMGAGCLQQAVDSMQAQGFKRALIVTDAGLVKTGLADKVAALLAAGYPVCRYLMAYIPIRPVPTSMPAWPAAGKTV